MTAYAGPNFDMNLIKTKLETPKPDGPPTILFIAKEFKRKGADTVAEAFTIVQSIIPEARLIFAGSLEIPTEFQGIKNVISLGLLDKSKPKELDLLLNAYRKADLMVLPSRHDPFPTSFARRCSLEFLVSLRIFGQCRRWSTKAKRILVNPGDSDTLAEQMIQILLNRELRERLGRAALRRADSMFNWQSVGRVLVKGLRQTITNGSDKEWTSQVGIPR